MNPPVRLHVDESVHNGLAYGLRSRGRDCTISNDVDLIAAADGEQLAYAIEQGRVVVTRDSDFAALHVEALAGGEHHPGIIYWCSKKHFGSVLKEIDQMLSDMSDDEFRDRIFYL